MDGIDDLLVEFRRRVQAAGFAVRPGVSADALEAFERTNRCSIPQDMRQFYAAIDGMTFGYPFENMIRLLPIEEIRPLPGNYFDEHPEGCFTIAEHLVYSSFYAMDIQAVAGPVGSVYLSQYPPLRVASAFTEFVRKMMDDSPELFQGEDS